MAGQWLSAAHNEREDVGSVPAADEAAMSNVLSPLTCSSPQRDVHTPASSPLACSPVEPNVSSPSSFVLPGSAYAVGETADSAQVGAQEEQKGGDEGQLECSACETSDIADSDFVIVGRGGPSEEANLSRHHARASRDLTSEDMTSPAHVSNSVVALLVGSAAELLASQLEIAVAARSGRHDTHREDGGWSHQDGRASRDAHGHGHGHGGQGDSEVDLTVTVTVRCVVVDGCGDEKGEDMERRLSWIHSLGGSSSSSSKSKSKRKSNLSRTSSEERQQCVVPAAIDPASLTLVPVLVVTAHEALACAGAIRSTSPCFSCCHNMGIGTPASMRACTCQDAVHDASAAAGRRSSSALQPAALDVWRQEGC